MKVDRFNVLHLSLFLPLSFSPSLSLPLYLSLSLLPVAALRFCRRIVGLKDEFYNRYIVRNNLFKPIIKAFIANGRRYNLINSAIIELFEYIKLVSLAMDSTRYSPAFQCYTQKKCAILKSLHSLWMRLVQLYIVHVCQLVIMA